MKDFNADKARGLADNYQNEDLNIILKQIEEASLKGRYTLYIKKDTHGIILYLLSMRGFEIIKPLSGNKNIISWEKSNK